MEGRSGEVDRAHLEELRQQPTNDLEETYRQLDALECAVRAERLQVLAVLDEREVGRADGALDTVEWVCETSRVTRSHAREQVETARALRKLPAIRTVAGTGALSWDQPCPVAQLATKDDDEDWARRSPGWSPAQLARALRTSRVVTTQEAEARHARRGVTWHWDRDHALRLRGYLPDVQGATLVQALERIAEQAAPGPDGKYEPYAARCADALVELAGQRLADDAEPDRAGVVVHLPAAALTDENMPGAGLGDADVGLANETVRRLTCDATWQPLLESPDCESVAVGRRTRTVPAAMQRAIRRRDRTCRFPGCSRTRALHAHHIVHHADGGVTELWNLVLLCPYHHRFVHEHGWWITGDTGRPDDLVFHAPDGRRLGGPRPRLRPEIRTRILQPA